MPKALVHQGKLERFNNKIIDTKFEPKYKLF
jgi:hypothetical protein